MPNTKSAERRARGSQKKFLQNRAVKSRLKSLERAFTAALSGGKRDEADKALRAVASAFDKAVKSGVIHRGKANRKKSRLAVRLNNAAA
jgi:small subunit ribosomal protein S20